MLERPNVRSSSSRRRRLAARPVGPAFCSAAFTGGQVPVERPPAARSLQRPASDGPPQLPRWPSGTAGYPTPFACSSLFSTVARDEPVEHLNSLPVAALAGIQIRYTGQRLSQRDADVFLHLLARANAVPLGQPVPFTARSLLLDLGWDTNSRGYVRLRDSVLKLKASAVQCEWTAGRDKRLAFAGSLIAAFAWKDEAIGRTLREWTIRFDPHLIRIFDESSYSLVHLRARRLLRNHELAKWLYAYLTVQPDGACALRARKVRELSGSKAKTLFGFRRTLRQALDVLVEQQLIEDYAIDSNRDLVSFGALLPTGDGPRPVRPVPPAAAARDGARLRLHITRSVAQLKPVQ